MSTYAPIPVWEYLKRLYEPDAEYVDGQVVERNPGEHDHSRLQALIAWALGQFEATHQLYVLVEQRVRVADTATKKRYRVPDVLALLPPYHKAPVLIDPPALIIEILSPEDRMSMMMVKVSDYEQFGVEYIFVIDPAQQLLYRAEDGGLKTVVDRIIRVASPEGEVAIDLKPLLASL